MQQRRIHDEALRGGRVAQAPILGDEDRVAQRRRARRNGLRVGQSRIVAIRQSAGKLHRVVAAQRMDCAQSSSAANVCPRDGKQVILLLIDLLLKRCQRTVAAALADTTTACELIERADKLGGRYFGDGNSISGSGIACSLHPRASRRSTEETGDKRTGIEEIALRHLGLTAAQ